MAVGMNHIDQQLIKSNILNLIVYILLYTLYKKYIYWNMTTNFIPDYKSIN